MSIPISILFVSLSCFVATSGLSVQDLPEEDPSSEAATADSEIVSLSEGVSVQQTVDDDAIAARLNEILESTKWFTTIEVRVDNGVAFLEGVARDDTARMWAGDLARRTEDVVAVVNRIDISTSDRPIALSQASIHVLQSLRGLWTDFLERLPLIFVGILVLFLTGIVDRFGSIVVRRSARKTGLRTSLQDLLVQLTTFGTWVAGITVAAIVIFPGMTPAKLLTVLGLGSVALGFAFKDIFENFFAGILILWRFPFDRGDFIECNGIEGQVEDVTIRMTQIRQVDGPLIVVPNAVLFKNPVNVLTSQSLRRTSVICGIAYHENVDESRRFIEEAVEACPTVASSRPVEVFASEFADSSVNFEVTWWTGSTPLEIRRSRDEVIANVKRALDDAGIVIPFPHRTLTFQQPLMPGDARSSDAVDSNV